MSAAVSVWTVNEVLNKRVMARAQSMEDGFEEMCRELVGAGYQYRYTEYDP